MIMIMIMIIVDFSSCVFSVLFGTNSALYLMWQLNTNVTRPPTLKDEKKKSGELKVELGRVSDGNRC